MRELWDDPVGVWALLELWALLCWAKPWQGLCGASCVVPVPLGLWGCCEGSRDTQSTAGHTSGPAVGVWGQPRLPCAHSSALVWSTQWPGQAGGSGQGPPWDQQSQIISSVCPWRRCRQLPSPHSARFMLWGGQRGKSVREEGLGAEMLLPSLQVSGCAPRRLWLLGELCSFSVRFPACSRFFSPHPFLCLTPRLCGLGPGWWLLGPSTALAGHGFPLLCFPEATRQRFKGGSSHLHL